MVEVIFAVFAITALVLFCFLAAPIAVTITCFAGWLILPVGNFPTGSADASVAYWIIGTALPSDMLLTKMWWPPVVALAAALLFDRKSFAECRPRWIDVPMALWCLWPMGQAYFVERPDPQAWISSLYLAASWGVPWLLGRIYFAGTDGGKRLLGALVAGLVVIAPIALVEGLVGPEFYDWVYELHPFRFDGAQRYIGFRPLAFFENGNQYGIWVAVTALAAIGLWQSTPNSPMRGWLGVVALLASTIALISQSAGAVFILTGTLTLLLLIGRAGMRWVIGLVLLVIALGGAVYLSGVVPLRAIADRTVIGRQVVEFVKSTGRGSFTWRIARDQRALPIIAEHPLVGSGRWDWWRRNGERPWGLVLLIIGQFGLVGLALAFGSVLAPVARTITNHWHPDAWRSVSVALAAIALMGIADALLNSFFFYPAILAAGASAFPFPNKMQTQSMSDGNRRRPHPT